MKLDDISPELLIARGQYATVRSAHEDEKKRMQILCGSIAATAAQILRAAQPDNDGPLPTDIIHSLILSARCSLDEVVLCVLELKELSEQRSELKSRAWPKTKS